MSRHFARRVDDNQGAIVSALRAAGATVQSLSRVGDGCPDLLVSFKGRTWVMEIKRPAGPRGGTSDRNLTEAESKWFVSWQGEKAIVRTISDALAIIGAIHGGQSDD